MDGNGNGNVTTTDEFKDIIKEIGRDTSADTIYGETQILGGRAIIPVAEVHYMGGGGLGGGRGVAGDDGAAGEMGAGYGEGMGVGFNVTARPLGAIEVTEDGVVWVPVLDVNKLALLWSGVSAFVVVLAALKMLFLRRS